MRVVQEAMTGKKVLLFSTFIWFLDCLLKPRWRPLEASLAAIGSQAESILDCIEDEEESGRPKPIDIDYLLANVIPPVLSVSGMYYDADTY